MTSVLVTTPTELAERAGTPAERGTLSIAEPVVEKIAARALAELGTVVTGGTRRLGLPGGSVPRVRARVRGSVVVLEARIALAYPHPVGATCQRVRGYLMDRVSTLTGLDVRQVDIRVAKLTAPAAAARRVR